MTNWVEYMRRVLEIVESRLVSNAKDNNVELDARMIMSVKDYISREVSFYQSRWLDHQRYGLRTPEEFAGLFGYRV